MIDLPPPDFAPEGELVGMRTVVDALNEEPFPLDKEAVYYLVGDVRLPDERGREHYVRDLLDHVDIDCFQSLGELVGALRDALEAAARPH